jgi:hypothetical protein
MLVQIALWRCAIRDREALSLVKALFAYASVLVDSRLSSQHPAPEAGRTLESLCELPLVRCGSAAAARCAAEQRRRCLSAQDSQERRLRDAAAERERLRAEEARAFEEALKLASATSVRPASEARSRGWQPPPSRARTAGSCPAEERLDSPRWQPHALPSPRWRARSSTPRLQSGTRSANEQALLRSIGELQTRLSRLPDAAPKEARPSSRQSQGASPFRAILSSSAACRPQGEVRVLNEALAAQLLAE